MNHVAQRVLDGLIDDVDWESLWIIDGERAGSVPGSLRKLLFSQNGPEAFEAYEELNNHVVVQGSVFRSAVACVPVLLGSISFRSELSPAALERTVALLWMMCCGWTDSEEVARGDQDVAREVDALLQDAFWLFLSLINDANEAVRINAMRLLSASSRPELLGLIGKYLTKARADLSLPDAVFEQWEFVLQARLDSLQETPNGSSEKSA